MTEVRIYEPAKTAMQSGRGNTKSWVIEYEPGSPKETDSLMGWAGSADTRSQVRIHFPSKEEAVAFAKKNGMNFRVQEPRSRRIKPKSYSDNFAYKRSF
ncbi:MAG: ETC complex I subunit [Proteobacteria bacterium]|nr:ETC complex I subunit [Pseudomonadota bacterium]MCH8238400.1 ETC complex I subunit [Pseudomonadota bacterium]